MPWRIYWNTNVGNIFTNILANFQNDQRGISWQINKLLSQMPQINSGETKPISSVPLFSQFFRIVETLFTCWISRIGDCEIVRVLSHKYDYEALFRANHCLWCAAKSSSFFSSSILPGKCLPHANIEHILVVMDIYGLIGLVGSCKKQEIECRKVWIQVTPGPIST